MRPTWPYFGLFLACGGGPAEEVEDLTAEVFLRAWQARERFSGDKEAALRWVLRIARNLVYDEFRKAKGRHPHQELSSAEMRDPQPGPEQHTLTNEEISALLGALDSLSPPQREMVVLRYILGWRVKEIASYLNMAENTVSVNIRRSLARMRDHWSSNQNETSPRTRSGDR